METSNSAEAVIETLRSRGWNVRDLEEIKALVVIQSALLDDANTHTIANSVESELLNMDLKSIGAKSLPDIIQLRKSSHLQGPIVLQITSVRDISRSSIEDYAHSTTRRLLRLGLTDGHTEITAIEYSNIPSIPSGIVPGTKVRLGNKVTVRSGVLCLNQKVVTVLGGVVQSLYEEWEMKKKYSGFSRPSLRRPLESDIGGPPPFEKLQIGEPTRRSTQPGKYSNYSRSTSKVNEPTVAQTVRSAETDNVRGKQKVKEDYIDNNMRSNPLGEKTEEKPSSSEMRPKEVSESVPVQNQAAAQKLLQKMHQPNQDDQRYKGRKYRGKGREEEPVVFTLDEWEKRKSVAKPITNNQLPDTSCDEELAWRLQNQLDMVESQAQHTQNAEAKNISLSMFNYERRDDHNFQGRGRGRGRGGGGGGGRGRGRGRRGKGR